MQKGFALWLVVAIVVIGVAVFYGTNKKEEPIAIPQVQTEESKPKQNTKPEEQIQPEQKILTQYQGEDVLNVRQISKEQMGRTVTLVAKVLNVNHNKQSNTVFFDIKDLNSDAKIKGVLFNKTINDNPERLDLLQSAANSGIPIYLKGEIDIYKGALEIKAWKIFTEDDSK